MNIVTTLRPTLQGRKRKETMRYGISTLGRSSGRRKSWGPTGDKIFEARLLWKYAGIKFVDIDSNPHRVFRVHPSTMQFEKERGNNHYSVVGILDGFDLEKPLDEEDSEPLYEP